MDKKATILLIDDEIDFCSLVEMHLSFVGNFKVICASSGREGLRLARQVMPDVIILDVVMPPPDGFAVLEKLKKDKETVAIPVIMLSCLDDDKSKERAARLYDEMYLTKPIDIYQLKAKIEEILKMRGF